MTHQMMKNWLAEFEQALVLRDFEKIMALFHEECYWRDLIAFTWNIKTLEGKNEIVAMLREVLCHVNPHQLEMRGEASEESGIIHGELTFETDMVKGEGYLRLVDGKCWTLLTSASALKGHEEKSFEIDEQEIREWKKSKKALSTQANSTYCLIIGGGQCGIALGARLKQLNVPAIILEKNRRPGDSWRNRYDSLFLHDPAWTHHLPYLPFPDDWPLFPHKDQLGDRLEAYTDLMGLDYWSSSECVNAQYLEDVEMWRVLVHRDGQQITLHSKQLVIATGMSGLPFVPRFPGADHFKGEQYHSTHFRSAQPYAQKHCMVLGSNNSAHDICADLYQKGACVTMIQPSSSSVVRLDTLMECNFNNYSETARKAGITTHKADLITASVPYKVKTIQSIALYKKIRQKDSLFYEKLTNAGFLLDFGEDESGSSMKYYRRGSGYYFNTGASEHIIEGKIKLKSGHTILSIKENSVVLTDGSELPSDLIIYATGFTSMTDWVAKLLSPEVAHKIGHCWGIGSNTKKDPGPWEGELRNMWKPTKQKNLWIHGGNLAQARFYSKLLALQIKARMEGLPTPIYT